jgi:Predicted ATPase
VSRRSRIEFGPKNSSPGGWIQSVELRQDKVDSFDEYPFDIPAIQLLGVLKFHPQVTFFIGENGSGKSTLIEALAVAAGLNAEGGDDELKFSTRASESELSEALWLNRKPKPWEETGFFLRAETFYNTATAVERMKVAEGRDARVFKPYGGLSPHEQSHGESFLALAMNRFWPKGLYILDEPEAALSPTRQLSLLQIIHHHVTQLRSQFIIATHSPILMAYPNATIYNLSEEGIQTISYEETEHYRITRDFLNNRETYLHALLEAAAVLSEE